MNRFLYLSFSVLLFLLGFQNSHAQEQTVTVGTPTKAEIELKACPFDSSASAVVLEEFGVFFPHIDWDLSFVEGSMEIHRRVKIFKKAGYHFGEIEIDYRDGTPENGREVSNIKGFTYNIDATGEVKTTKLDPKSIFDVKTNGKHKKKKFALPDLEEGSIIEYSYVLNTPLYGMTGWTFQSSIPTLYSQFQLIYGNGFGFLTEYFISKPLDVNKLCENIDKKFDLRSQTDQIDKRDVKCVAMARKDVPAFKEEAFTTSVSDYFERVYLYLREYNINSRHEILIKSWPEFVHGMLEDEDYGKYFKKKNAVRDSVQRILALTNPKTKMDTISTLREWVAKKTLTTSMDDVYADFSPKEVLEKKKGNIASINILLIALLREAGIDANPVLLSTRSNGKPNKLMALSHKFNYTLAAVQIDSNYMLLDGVNGQMQAGAIPFETLNGEGLLMDVKTEKFKWIPLKNYVKMVVFRNAVFDVLTDGTLKGSVETSKRNYDSYTDREAIASKGKDEFIQTEYKPILANGKIESQQVGDLINLGAPLKSSVKITTTDFIQVNNDLIYISPMLNYGKIENPFKLSERTYPVDFGFPSEEIFQAQYNIPEGYKIEEAPKSQIFKLGAEEGMKLEYIVETLDSKCLIKTKLSNPVSAYAPEAYQFLKKFMTQVIAKEGEQIVLKKIIK